MLIAEDLLLLLTDDVSGKLCSSSDEVDIALGGALLVELALAGRVDVAGGDESVKAGRLVVRDPTPTGDDLLDEALERVSRKAGKKPQDVVSGIGSGLHKRLYRRLADQGVLREERRKLLHTFPVTRWPAVRTEPETAVRTGLHAALQRGLVGDERTAALVALLHALGVVAKVVDAQALGLSKKELKAHAQRIAEGDWAATAVRKAVEASQAAVAAVVAGGAVVASSVGS